MTTTNSSDRIQPVPSPRRPVRRPNSEPPRPPQTAVPGGIVESGVDSTPDVPPATLGSLPPDREDTDGYLEVLDLEDVEVDSRVSATFELGFGGDPDDDDDVRETTVAGARLPSSVSPSESRVAATVVGGGSAPDLPQVTGSARRYGVKRELARGGMGAILIARDHDLRRNVAMKVLLGANRKNLDPEIKRRRVARFLAEAQITGQLQHPNIVPVHEIGVDSSGRPWFTMKLVRGESLAAIIKRLRAARDGGVIGAPDEDRQWTRARLLEVFQKVCDAIAYAHSRGVIHRDLKPENLMVGRFGEVLVMDWGIARLNRPEGGDEPVATVDDKFRSTGEIDTTREVTRADQTAVGTVMGTPAYMAPEQALGEIDSIDQRTDVHALGAILYELLTFTSAYNPGGKGDPVTVLQAVQSARPPDPPDIRAPEANIPVELSAICMTAMAHKQRHRYQSVSALQDDLRAWSEGRGISVLDESWWRRSIKWISRNRLAAAAIGAAAVALLSVTLATIISLQAAAQAARERADAAEDKQLRLQAEADARDERLRRMAEEERFADLRRAVGASVESDRDRKRDAFINLWTERRPHHINDESFFAEVGEQRLREFMDAFERAISAHRVDPSSTRVSPRDYLYLGILHNGAGNTSEALYHYSKCLELDNTDFLALMNRGGLQMRLGHLREAAVDFERVTELYPDDARAWATRGDLVRKTNPPASIRFYERALELDPSEPHALLGIGAAYSAIGQVDKGRPYLDRALAAGRVDAWFHRARGFMLTGDMEAARRDLNQLLRVNPDHADALLMRGADHQAHGRNLDALADLERAADLAPDNWRVWANVGALRVDMGRREEGLAAMMRAYRQCPDPNMRQRIADNIRIAGGELPD